MEKPSDSCCGWLKLPSTYYCTVIDALDHRDFIEKMIPAGCATYFEHGRTVMDLTIYGFKAGIPRDTPDGHSGSSLKQIVFNKINWLDLPDHILGFIADKLVEINDYIRFGVVCRPWQSIYIENMHHRRRCCPQIPLLLLPTEHNHDHDNQTRSLYNLTEKTVIRNFQLRDAWLVILDENFTKLTLLNPFLSSDNDIELPSSTTLPHDMREIFNEKFLDKAVLSANPSTNPNYVVMAIYGQFDRLAFFKPGDKTWNPLDPSKILMEDVIYFKDQFYVVNFGGDVFSYDMTHPHPKLMKVASSPTIHITGKKKYLVDSSGDLLQVLREIVSDVSEVHWTIRFEVFKLDLSKLNWVQVKSFGNQSLFLGDNSSISVSSLDFPGCKSNCIYFTDDNFEGYYKQACGPHDMGVFNIEHGSFEEPFYLLQIKGIFPPPVWIQPTLQHLSN
ncbi:hypothetical protein AQUCO_01300517v1 [Aquilegia coerulea]|uniref:KIB1-4 beta-propeller domain-containing protein n=1 Tax=Aquilegia coerulea TaxID=218851 RepID=A0A2G5E259_AQUCA|nr:hypothetical protein AQUCO_01300517v1 [Aquilegia coerulea]